MVRARNIVGILKAIIPIGATAMTMAPDFEASTADAADASTYLISSTDSASNPTLETTFEQQLRMTRV